MTLRNFWFAFFTYVLFFAAMVLCAFLFGTTSMMPGRNLTAEERYIMEIEALPIRPYFSLMPKGNYEDFESLIKHGTPNLVVRVTFEDREDATVYDPHGYYNDDTFADAVAAVKDDPAWKDRHPIHLSREESDGSIYKWNDDHVFEKVENMSLYISTPYEAHIEEVLLGDALKVGDDFTFYAPYGIIDDFYIRYEDCPIFSEGREYILFFSIVEIEGVGLWYDLVHPSAACEILIEDTRTFATMSRAGDVMFSEAGSDCERLAGLLVSYYEENPYSFDIPTMQRMKPGSIYDNW